ncbi:MAG: aminomethyl-transferring glycine dehydrogenase subunit GcvPB [Deltaproteobacteria bacterium]|nr:aminomethyl-transferring glycine dehydrogenase subunit GcvPB [Deltaproteobacteria bacterium]
MRPLQAHTVLHVEPPIFELGAAGRSGASLPEMDVPEIDPGQEFGVDVLRCEDPLLPEVSELEVIRHYTRLSQWNYSIDEGFYPLGSCTMKYNPRVNEWTARLQGLTDIHPYQNDDQIQGALELMWRLEHALAAVGGFARVTLQPAAGAHGEFTGLKVIRAALSARGERRRKVLVPDSAHGTNPASVAFNGFAPVLLASGEAGILRPQDVEQALEREGADQVAALMVTNPNTLGLFESHIAEIAKILHSAGAMLYMDGANLNAIMGKVRPADTGVDVMHYNLHKTFSTPHGGGGPGAGPVGVTEELARFLPVPVVERRNGRFVLDYDRPDSVGRVRSFMGNFGVLVRAYTYLREMGADGIARATELAVLNANYVRARIEKEYPAQYGGACLHEVVLSDHRIEKETSVTTLDVAKRLIDYGFHPPTIYFPLIVHGALMIEPTETEPLEEVERFCQAMEAIFVEAHEDPELLKHAPHSRGVNRMDEVRAARKPVLRWRPEASDS